MCIDWDHNMRSENYYGNKNWKKNFWKSQQLNKVKMTQVCDVAHILHLKSKECWQIIQNFINQNTIETDSIIIIMVRKDTGLGMYISVPFPQCMYWNRLLCYTFSVMNRTNADVIWQLSITPSICNVIHSRIRMETNSK